MPRKAKYRPGPAIRDPVTVMSMLVHGSWFYWQGKPKHPSVLKNMSVLVIERAARKGRLRLALENIDR